MMAVVSRFAAAAAPGCNGECGLFTGVGFSPSIPKVSERVKTSIWGELHGG
jgi:hypothetical protein